MRLLFVFLFASLVTTGSIAQVENPIQWVFTAKKINASTYEAYLSATINSGWHIYSQTTPDGGPVPTSISYTKNPLLFFDGVTKEIGVLEQRHEELFGVDVKQFSKKVDFVQKVKVKGKAKTYVTGSIYFMVCNDKQCLPPKTVTFSIPLN